MFVFLVELYGETFALSQNLYFLVLTFKFVPNFSFSGILSLGGWGGPRKD